MSQGTLPPNPGSPPDLIVEDTQPAASPGDARPRAARGMWVRVGLAVAILAISGVARGWQASRVDQILREGREAPFALEDIPMQIGPWQGEDQEVDEQIIRITGSTDSIFRTYQNQNTGQRVSVLVLFGPSTAMSGHVPEVCYPSSGYGMVRDATTRVVESEAGQSWPFRELVYAKGEGGQLDMQDVLYTWRHDGKWNPNLGGYKELERLPSLFKVQVARRVRNEAELNLLKADNPCVDHLVLLMDEIDRRIAQAEQTRTVASRP